MKKILITGVGSYIGTAFEDYMNQWQGEYQIEAIDTHDIHPTPELFASYDVIFHVAGIAHIHETENNKSIFYQVNRDLTIEIGRQAKVAQVKQFVVLSSMSVYGMTVGEITKGTEELPVNAYGESKYQADLVLQAESCTDFKVAILRPPMVYGKGCKGNYQQLRKFALRSPLFPECKNARSMIYIGNLCEFVKQIIDTEATGIFFPQNAEYVCTSDMVRLIAKANGRNIVLTRMFNPLFKILRFKILDKVFGTLVYEKVDTVDKYSFEESIQLTEN